MNTRKAAFLAEPVGSETRGFVATSDSHPDAEQFPIPASLARPCVERDDAWLWRYDRQLWTKSEDRFGPQALSRQPSSEVRFAAEAVLMVDGLRMAAPAGRRHPAKAACKNGCFGRPLAMQPFRQAHRLSAQCGLNTRKMRCAAPTSQRDASPESPDAGRNPSP